MGSFEFLLLLVDFKSVLALSTFVTVNAHRRRALGVVAFSQLFLLGIALAREFIGQLEHLESS